MRDREIARAASDAMARQARRTRANERGQVLGTDEDTGNLRVSYNGAEIILPWSGPPAQTDSWVNLSRSSAGLQIPDRSCYGGG